MVDFGGRASTRILGLAYNKYLVKVCQSCGSQARDDAIHCSTCGTKLPSQVSVRAPAPAAAVPHRPAHPLPNPSPGPRPTTSPTQTHLQPSQSVYVGSPRLLVPYWCWGVLICAFPAFALLETLMPPQTRSEVCWQLLPSMLTGLIGMTIFGTFVAALTKRPYPFAASAERLYATLGLTLMLLSLLWLGWGLRNVSLMYEVGSALSSPPR